MVNQIALASSPKRSQPSNYNGVLPNRPNLPRQVATFSGHPAHQSAHLPSPVNHIANNTRCKSVEQWPSFTASFQHATTHAVIFKQVNRHCRVSRRVSFPRFSSLQSTCSHGHVGRPISALSLVLLAITETSVYCIEIGPHQQSTNAERLLRLAFHKYRSCQPKMPTSVECALYLCRNLT